MSSEKTEQPTENRLRKAREDGQVPKSKDFTQTLMMAALTGYTLALGPDIFKSFAEMLQIPGQLWGMEFRGAIALALGTVVRAGISILLPYLLIVIVVGVSAEVLQSGFVFSIKALMPKGDKLNPVTNLQQMFAGKAWIEFAKSCLKVVFLCALVFMVIRDSMAPLVKVPAAGMGASGMVLYQMMHTLVVYTFVGFGAVALFDLVLQRHSYIKGLMMSMEEIKQEFKQMEGDPHVKGHRKEMAREIAMGEMVEHTRDASVVVTNPTHVAVAIRFVEGETPLPVVLGKGEGAVAEAIKRVAREEGIPILQNVPLARSLLELAEVGHYIPSELLEPVAEVLLAIRRLSEERELRDDGREEDRRG